MRSRPAICGTSAIPCEDGGEGVVVATTRPETMLGDTAVAVNPEDERYTRPGGQERSFCPSSNQEIPVVADEYVDMEFGTGAVKMTPAHDPNDFEVGKRHNLEVIRVMNDDGTMNENGGKYAGHGPLWSARKAIVERPGRAGLPGQDRGLHPQRGHLLPLRHTRSSP